MITYNEIYEAARKERYSDQLQSLPKNFIASVADYLKEKKELSLKEDDVFSDSTLKTKKQLENAITLFNELKRIRRRKILNLVLIASETGISKRDFDNMLDFERMLFEDIMKSIDASDKKFNEILANGNGGKGDKPAEVENDMVTFLEDVEAFMGLDGEMTGPFEKGQIANLPKQIAQILIDDKKAEKVED